MIRLLAGVFVLLSCAPVWAACRSDQVQLRGDWGAARFTVELADTPEERSRGLMFREKMAASAGMLFVYEKPQRASFWMKNTLIPLDLLFVDRTGLVMRVHPDAVPGDLSAIDGGEDVFAVLEINAGLAKSYGIVAGSQMQHPVFSDATALWPC
jgi:uncharacterized membrane protein (UPF0127 family)